MSILYDKTGAAYSLDHEVDGTAYVRPMVKVIVQTTDWNDEPHEEDAGHEPADYLVAKERASLFDAPPVEQVDAEISEKRAELENLRREAIKVKRELETERLSAKSKLDYAKRQFDDWMNSHRVMMDLGKLLDGKVLFPLAVNKNPYHHSRDVPRIPDMRNASYLELRNGDFEKGQPWACKKYASDSYGSPFMFFDTEEERSAVIHAEFVQACDAFRQSPNFDTTSYSTGTKLHYGTLMEWVKVHPSLAIPDDIKAMKAAHDAALVEQRKAQLAAELAQIEAAS